MNNESEPREDQSFSQAEQYAQLADEPRIAPPSSLKAMQELRVAGRGLKTSQGLMFGGEHDVWGRDRSITAMDLISQNPEIAEETILTLAALQGSTFNNRSGEEPGRILTEHREIYRNDQLPFMTKAGLSIMSKLWGGELGQYTTYFSSDTSPLFVKLISEYGKVNPLFLDHNVDKADGSQETVRQAALAAAHWIKSRVGEDGLIEIREKNLLGNQFRYWRDSPNSYRDESGHTPNITEPMVLLDIQALSAEALDAAAGLAGSEEAAQFRETAGRIRQATLEHLWMEDEQYFAYGLSQDETGNNVLIRTIQSNAGWLLNTDFFDTMPKAEQQKYVDGIVRRLFSDEFLTDAGIRTRSLRHIDDRDFADYHGSWVTWPVETFMIAKGLRRQHLPLLADQLEARLLNTINMSGINYEFFVVDRDGKVLLDPHRAKSEADIALPIEMRPENSIAWTVTATLRLKRESGMRVRDTRPGPAVEPWRQELEASVLGSIKQVPRYKTKEQLRENFYPQPHLYLDQMAGLRKAAGNIVREMALPALKHRLQLAFRRTPRQ